MLLRSEEAELQMMVMQQNLGEQKDFRSLAHATGDRNIADVGTTSPFAPAIELHPGLTRPSPLMANGCGEIGNFGGVRTDTVAAIDAAWVLEAQIFTLTLGVATSS